MTNQKLSELFERSKNDREIIVGSEIREAVGTAMDLLRERGELPPDAHPDEARPRGTTWLAERKNWQSEVERLRDENKSLAKFKAYVHKRLDDAGVPADPDSPHKAEGCRIGGRLNIVLAYFVGANPR